MPSPISSMFVPDSRFVIMRSTPINVRSSFHMAKNGAVLAHGGGRAGIVPPNERPFTRGIVWNGRGEMNRSKRIFCLAAALAVALSCGAQAAFAKDPLEGTWVLNVEKSTFKVAPGPRGQTRTYSMSDDGVEKLVARGVS